MIPEISVIMSVYNTDELFLREAIESILNQTFTNFEFLIFDDASTDGSDLIIKEYERKDCRVKYIKNEVNLGLTRTLNKGLNLAKGKYIARMDADDISLPDRFIKQINFLNTNSSVMALGTAFYVKSDNKIIKHKIGSVDPERIKVRLFFENSYLLHSSMMIKKDTLEKYLISYDESIKKSQDYDMWVRLSRVGDISVIKNYLSVYRISKTQISTKSKEEQKSYKDLISLKQLFELGLKPDAKNIDCHIALCDTSKHFDPQKLSEWVETVVKQNNKISLFNKDLFEYSIYKRFIKMIFKQTINSRRLPNIKELITVFKSFTRSFIKIIYKNMRKPLKELFIANRRRKLIHHDFTIISNNCFGGHVYQDFGLPYLSPTVGLFIMPEDYIKMVSNLREYMTKELSFVDASYSKYATYLSEKTDKFGYYPIGVLGDIEIHFLHYQTRLEAKEKWSRRVSRINWEKIILKFNDQNLCEENQINAFLKINNPNKICFVASSTKRVNGLTIMHQFSKHGYVLDDGNKYMKYINMTEFINGIKSTEELYGG